MKVHQREVDGQTLRYVIKECFVCGGDVEVPESQANNGAESYCSISCLDTGTGEK